MCLGRLVPPANLLVHLPLVVVVIRERTVYLAQRKVRVVLVDRQGVPAVRDLVESDSSTLVWVPAR